MKISYNWLKEYVNIDLSPEELAEKLTSAGVVVEHVTPAFEAIDSVVVAQIKEIVKHPDADKLSITQIDNGKEILQVVCGASNIKVGQKIPLAQVGTVLPGDFKIKKSKIRGVESFGMLCSGEELGLDLELEDGILILPEDSQIGVPIGDALGLNDYILLLDLTPNRSDCLSILGVAKEVAALTGQEFKLPELGEISREVENFDIEINTEDCKNYIGAHIQDLKIGPSPIWLQIKLLKAGLRPINNVVDITNYVMLEYGQPLHAFDKNKITTNKIVVKNLEVETQFKTLDGQLRSVPAQTLTITDGNTPIAVAGVMGGEESEVDENTAEIILESAYFDNVAVRKSVKNINLRSEASARFEKSVAPLYIKDAALRAAKLLEDVCGATAIGMIAVGDFTYQGKKIALDPKRVKSLLGVEILDAEIEKILISLGCTTTREENKFIVEPPHHRVDLNQQVDLIEELARIYGYDNIPVSLPTGKTTVGKVSSKEQLFRNIKNYLTAQGLAEIITYPFISPESFAKSSLDAELAIPLANPLGRENSLMRTSLLPSALATVSHNINHQVSNIQFFELGKVYLGQLPLIELPKEKESLVVVQLGESEGQHWLTGQGRKKDFYSIKGVLESIMSLANIGVWDLKQEDNSIYHPGRSGAIYIGKTKVGSIGQIHPTITKNWDVKQEVYALELDLLELVENSGKKIGYKSVVKYPAVKRDLALIINKDIEAGKLTKAIVESSPLITNAEIFDVYEGKGIEPDKKSIAISITLQKNGTLKDNEINFFVNNALKKLEENFGAKLRS